MMAWLVEKQQEQFAESAELDDRIRENLKRY